VNFLRAVSLGYRWHRPRSLHPLKMTTQCACKRIRWGGVGVVEAPIADTSLADGLFWPSPSSGICMTGAMGWRGGRAGFPLFLMVPSRSPWFRGVFFVMGGHIP